MTVLSKTREPRTEAEIRAVLLRRALRLYKHQSGYPNSTVYGWESDLLTTTRAGMVHEYEIKTSRSDWLAEAKAIRGDRRAPAPKRRRAQDLTDHRTSAPNYFWIVACADVMDPDEAPRYAGVIIAHWLELSGLEVRRRAPRLHGEHVSPKIRESIERGTALRYSDKLWEEL